ncbi:MAG: hypothetical protein KGS61_11870, partial [Verrucomicrobia bacterium]|nr:hypothetical protein [Verrucomicrobiota bacterium]
LMTQWLTFRETCKRSTARPQLQPLGSKPIALSISWSIRIAGFKLGSLSMIFDFGSQAHILDFFASVATTRQVVAPTKLVAPSLFADQFARG